MSKCSLRLCPHKCVPSALAVSVFCGLKRRDASASLRYTAKLYSAQCDLGSISKLTLAVSEQMIKYWTWNMIWRPSRLFGGFFQLLNNWETWNSNWSDWSERSSKTLFQRLSVSLNKFYKFDLLFERILIRSKFEIWTGSLQLFSTVSSFYNANIKC